MLRRIDLITRMEPVLMKSLTIAAGLLLLCACGERAAIDPQLAAQMQARQAQAGKPGFAQSLEVTIDGKVHRIDMDRPRDGHIGGASVVGNRVLNLHAGDRQANFMLGLSAFAPQGQALAPASLEAYECRTSVGCNREPGSDNPGAMLIPYPADQPPPVRELRSAFKGPVVGLQPVSVNLTKIEDAYWDGAGPTKRVQGTFTGRFAYVEEGRDHVPRIVGQVRQVHGKFDLHAIIR